MAAMPDLPGCVLTMDALHAVKKTIEIAVIGKRADVLICVKDNAADLQRTVHKHLNRRRKRLLTAQTLDHAHGRIEKRSIEMAPIRPEQTGWPHTHTACRIRRERRMIRRGQVVSTSCEEVSYIASFSAEQYPPATVLELIRGHWSIENCLHHRKDRSMDEDRCRAAGSRTGRVMCCLRSIAAMVLGRAKETLSVIQRRFSAKPHLLLRLLFCASLDDWERRYKPYTLALA